MNKNVGPCRLVLFCFLLLGEVALHPTPPPFGVQKFRKEEEGEKKVEAFPLKGLQHGKTFERVGIGMAERLQNTWTSP